MALIAGEPAVAAGFGLTALIGGIAGGGLVYGFRSARGQSALLARRAHAQPVVALAWVAAAVLAAVPFAVAGWGAASAEAFADPVNALFESMSGLTSTGLTVASDASTLPRGLQWWRSLLQWVGGVGVLYFVLALAPPEHDGSHRSELDEEMNARVSGSHLLAIWAIYAGYTLGAILAFWAVGMPLWEAVNHSMTSISTGGFTVTSDSFASYGRPVHAVGGVVILLGAISFGIHYVVLLHGRFDRIARDSQNRLLAALLAVGTLALVLAVAAAGMDLPFADAAFQWASALLTAGFSTQDVGAWGAGPLLILVVGMFIGGASGSTAGGLKQRRALALLRRSGAPHATMRRTAALQQLVRLAAALGLGTGLLMLLGEAGGLEALFEAASALGTVGLSVGVTDADLPVGGRLVLIALMWAGRLEVAAVLALLARPRSSVKS